METGMSTEGSLINKKATGYYIILMFIFISSVWSQDVHSSNYNQDTLIAAAEKMMIAAKYCAIITLDDSGQPQARIMHPFSPEEDLVVWLGTNSESRKVGEIRNDSRVTLYYKSPDESGYVVIKGNAYLVDNLEMKSKYWKKEWEDFYSDEKENYLLIKVVPDVLEIIDYNQGITGDSETWAVPYVEFIQKK